jgi:hypothetical protein
VTSTKTARKNSLYLQAVKNFAIIFSQPGIMEILPFPHGTWLPLHPVPAKAYYWRYIAKYS